MSCIVRFVQLVLLFIAVSPLPATAQWPKRGIPYNNVALIQHFNGGGSQVNWAWNWDSYMDPSFPSYMEFVPCLWSDSGDHTGSWANNVNNAISRGTGHIMSFNEPDACGSGQSCISPQQAVNAYRTYMQPYAGRVALGAPQVSNGPNGLSWLKSFLSLCTGCQIDFLPIHWYDENVSGALGYFYDYIGQAYAAGGYRQLWITEFALWHNANEADQEYFLGQVIPWMDQQSYIYRYSWFMCTSDNNVETQGTLCTAAGWPTNLGNAYAYQPF